MHNLKRQNTSKTDLLSIISTNNNQNFDKERFLDLLGKSISLSGEEKICIIESISHLSQNQIEGLIKTFEKEQNGLTDMREKNKESGYFDRLKIEKEKEWKDITEHIIRKSKDISSKEGVDSRLQNYINLYKKKDKIKTISPHINKENSSSIPYLIIPDAENKIIGWGRFGFEPCRVQPQIFDEISFLSFLSHLRKYDDVTYEMRLINGNGEFPRLQLLASMPIKIEKDIKMIEIKSRWHYNLLKQFVPWVMWQPIDSEILEEAVKKPKGCLTILRVPAYDLKSENIYASVSLPSISKFTNWFRLGNSIKNEPAGTFVGFRFTPHPYDLDMLNRLEQISENIDLNVTDLKRIERGDILTLQGEIKTSTDISKYSFIKNLTSQPNSWFDFEIYVHSKGLTDGWIETVETSLSGMIADCFVREQEPFEPEKLCDEYSKGYLLKGNDAISSIIPGNLLFPYIIPPYDTSLFKYIFNLDSEITLPPPAILEKGNILIGTYGSKGESKRICQKRQDRFMHTYILGKSGTGKSTLIQNMVLQDIANADNGICLIDPHGDLIQKVVDTLPPERLKDVVLAQFNDLPEGENGAFPISLFDGTLTSDIERSKAISEHIDAMIQLYGDEIFSPRLQHYARGIIQLLLCRKSEYGIARPIEIMKFSSSSEFALQVYNDALSNEKLDRFGRTIITEFYEFYNAQHYNEKTEMITYFHAKYIHLSGTSIMLNTFNQGKPKVSIRKIMDGGKIFLVNLSKGSLGPMDAKLIGTTILSKIYIETMRRAQIPEKERRPFILYIDEFQNFLTPSFEYMLAEARKYKIGLVLAHQNIAQLTRRSYISPPTFIKEAVLGNTGTQIICRISAEDAEIISRELGGYFAPTFFTSLPNYKALTRISADGQIHGPYQVSMMPPAGHIYSKNYEIIRDYCYVNYYGEY